MQIIQKNVDSLIPYENNPRDNDKAVTYVANSIEEFGFKVPIVIDTDNVIVAGHTRIKAAKLLGLDTVPCIVADDLNEEQIRAFRLADNKVSEYATWDEELLTQELEGFDELDLAEFGFNRSNDFFDKKEFDDSRQEGNDEYNDFLDKFETKKTTDDCYTPQNVYDAIADWVAKEYGLKKVNFIRPFYPNGDYQKEKYKKDDVVVDNPPFSISSQIVDFYLEHNIKFFLFATTMTLWGSYRKGVCYYPCGGQITYENGAVVPTSFMSNLDDKLIRVIPELYQIIKEANDYNVSKMKRTIPKYEYPNEVLSSAMCRYLCEHDTPFNVEPSDAYFIRALESQREVDKAIFGGGSYFQRKQPQRKQPQLFGSCLIENLKL